MKLATKILKSLHLIHSHPNNTTILQVHRVHNQVGVNCRLPSYTIYAVYTRKSQCFCKCLRLPTLGLSPPSHMLTTGELTFHLLRAHRYTTSWTTKKYSYKNVMTENYHLDATFMIGHSKWNILRATNQKCC